MSDVEEGGVPDEGFAASRSRAISPELRKLTFVCLLILTLIELSPANEVARLAVWLAAGGISHRPLLGAVSYGGATLVIEFVGVFAAAPILGTSSSRRFTVLLNQKVNRILKREHTRPSSWTTRTMAVLFGGSVVAMALKLREATDTPDSELRRLGLVVSSWLAVACAVQGALMSEGIKLGLQYPPEAITLITVAVVIASITLLMRSRRGAARAPVGDVES